MAVFEISVKDKAIKMNWQTVLALITVLFIIMAYISDNVSSSSEIKTKVADNINEIDKIRYTQYQIEDRIDKYSEKLVSIETKVDFIIDNLNKEG
jgi:peptidoglycan hydrolase CwlO-like protein